VSLNEFGVEVCEMGSQAGQSMLGRAAATAGADDGLGGGPSISDKMIMKLPTSAMTSLCEIRFDRKNVVPMNVLMCRKIIAALYQVKAEANATDIGKKRQGFPDFVPDQFVVLYGIKSIAIAKVNEFFYGVREGRFRKNIKDEDEEDPLVYAFWQACHHGVPTQARMPGDDFDVYIDVLAATAKTVGEEHTLKMPGIGAFYHLLGSMAEIQLPAFVLINVLQRLYGPDPIDPTSKPGMPALLERLKRTTLARVGAFMKVVKSRRPPQPAPSYKPTLLGNEGLDSRGYLPLEKFVTSCMEGVKEQRAKDAKVLEAIYATWYTDEQGFDSFADMVEHAHQEISEDEIVAFYQKATGGDDPDVLEMALIEADLRAYPITLKRRPGPTASTEASTEASTGALDASRAAGAPLCAPAAALGAGSSAASQMGGRRGWSVAARTATALGFVSKVSKTIRDLLPLDELP